MGEVVGRSEVEVSAELAPRGLALLVGEARLDAASESVGRWAAREMVLAKEKPLIEDLWLVLH